jgi:hypothetical protein
MTFGLSGAALAGIAIGGAGIATGIYSANKASSSADRASQAQTQSAQSGIDEQRRQFDALQKLLSPFVSAGTGALGGQQDLLGLNGAGAQQSAISGIQSSPQFQALTQQGEDSILANASATGGLRGGNVQSALAQFRPQLLSQLIDQQYSRLGGLTSLGQNAAAGVGNAGMATGSAVAGLMGQQGSAAAGAALAGGRASAMGASGLTNGLMSGFGVYQGLGGFGSPSIYDASAARAATSAQQSGMAAGAGDFQFSPSPISIPSLPF